MNQSERHIYEILLLPLVAEAIECECNSIQCA